MKERSGSKTSRRRPFAYRAPSEEVRQKADLSRHALEPLSKRLDGCNQLLTVAVSALKKKFDNIAMASTYQNAGLPDERLEDMREEFAELEHSSCLHRAAEDCEIVARNLLQLAAEFRRLRGDTAPV